MLQRSTTKSCAPNTVSHHFTLLSRSSPERFPLTEFGCKRLIVDTGYYECLHRPNLELSKDPIVEINETGILTKNGMHGRPSVINSVTYHSSPRPRQMDSSSLML